MAYKVYSTNYLMKLTKAEIIDILRTAEHNYIATEEALTRSADYGKGLLKEIEQLKKADVQPANQWISVKERQPDKDDLYLVAVENEICVYMDIADYSNNQWHKHDEVIYWQPLPELPKEG